MFGFLKRLFKGKHPLHMAAESGDVARFGRELMASKVVVVHAELGEGLPMQATESEVLKIVEKAASRPLPDSRIFTYQDEGKSCLPFFLSQADADGFCGAYSGREQTLFAYQICEVQGSAIARLGRTIDQLVMNAQGDDEFKLSPEWLPALQSLSTSDNSEVKMTRLAVGIALPSRRA